MREIVVIAASALALGSAGSCSERGPAPSGAPGEASRGADEAAAEEVNAVKDSSRTPKRVENAFEAQVAGGFYTGDPDELRRQVKGFLDAASSAGAEKDRDIVAILAPHAGYRYSGPIAGEAFRAVTDRGYRAVVVMAPSHRRAASKAALLDRPAYDTPLGSLRIDRGLVRRLIEAHGDLFEVNEAVFRGEHALEVELPFVQVALPGASLVPIIVAVHDDDAVDRIGRALFKELGARGDVLFVVSSDLSHHHPYDEAKGYDEKSLRLLEEWKIGAWKEHASRQSQGMCGYRPASVLVSMLEGYDAADRKVARLDYRNSGDTAGDRSAVVGYGALAFSLPEGKRTEEGSGGDFGPFSVEDRRALMDLAKRSVAAAVRGERLEPGEPAPGPLADAGAAFVTLKKRGQLRGCIGHVVARIPLYRCVADVARAAAIHDTRFSPVAPEELGDLTYEISVLTAPVTRNRPVPSARLAPTSIWRKPVSVIDSNSRNSA